MKMKAFNVKRCGFFSDFLEWKYLKIYNKLCQRLLSRNEWNMCQMTTAPC